MVFESIFCKVLDFANFLFLATGDQLRFNLLSFMVLEILEDFSTKFVIIKQYFNFPELSNFPTLAKIHV